MGVAIGEVASDEGAERPACGLVEEAAADSSGGGEVLSEVTGVVDGVPDSHGCEIWR